MVEDWPDPREATDAAEFVVAMRTLRARTDLSYRVLERRAAKAGTPLPSSTISGALSRDTLPRADLLATFIRACGADDATTEHWLAARADLAASEQAPESEPLVPEALSEDQPGRKRSKLWWPSIGVAVVVVLVAGGLLVLGDPFPEQPGALPGSSSAAAPLTSVSVTTSEATKASLGTPPTGRSRVRLAHTGLCIGEGPEKFVQEERIVLGQQDCATASPTMSVEAVDGGYRLLLHSPENGEGCVTVDYGGTHASTLLAGDNCEPGRPDQRFAFEPVTAPAKGYLIKSAAGARWCVGVFKGSGETGVQLIQDRCDGTAAQVFLIDPVV
ncbi:helix-turn-helix domain-containing protein [Amycolatopsis alba]|uniref:XRE family transcriptional regulator n=1 Tax=Amycolatopsis alba DSM 44262 TaxID=1125972 RepID=A0A229S7Q9_AMYAL|nr:helix-turn-helix transcriptional regulator [Amycolatopsis alba]OXM54719.1 XRE family transcriptional regulator [Amycolatopsis alba DSM 44262]